MMSWCPSQLADLTYVDRITAVMPQTVCDFLYQGFRFSQFFQNHFGNLNIFQLIPAANIIYLTGCSFLKNDINSFAIINHIKPVPHILPVSVQRERLVIDGIGDKQGNQFFRILIRTVIVGTPGDDGWQPVCFMVSTNQQVTSRFAGGIGAVGLNGTVLDK